MNNPSIKQTIDQTRAEALNTPSLDSQTACQLLEEATNNQTISAHERAIRVVQLSEKLLARNPSKEVIIASAKYSSIAFRAAQKEAPFSRDNLTHAGAIVHALRADGMPETFSLAELLEIGKTFLAFSRWKVQLGRLIAEQVPRHVAEATPDEVMDILWLLPKLGSSDSFFMKCLPRRIAETGAQWSLDNLVKAVYALEHFGFSDKRLHREILSKLSDGDLTPATLHKACGTIAKARLREPLVQAKLIDLFVSGHHALEQSVFCDIVRSFGMMRMAAGLDITRLRRAAEEGAQERLTAFSAAEASIVASALDSLGSSNFSLSDALASRVADARAELDKSSAEALAKLLSSHTNQDSHAFDIVAQALERKIKFCHTGDLKRACRALREANITDKQLWAAIEARRAKDAHNRS